MTMPKKFDAAPVGVDKAVNKGYGEFPYASLRRVIDQLNNRVIGDIGKYGTAALADGITTAALAAGTGGNGTCGTAKGVGMGNAVQVAINGALVSVTKDIEISMGSLAGGAEVQAVDTFCKYLVSAGTAGTCVVTQGNQGATAALAKLPDLPDNSCPLGYVTINTTGGAYTAGAELGLDDAALVVTYTNLISYPMNG